MVTKRIKPITGGGNVNPKTPPSAIIHNSDSNSTSASHTKTCPLLSTEAKTILKTWCSNHPHDGTVGYPTPPETMELIQRTGLTKGQLDQWFFQRWKKKQNGIAPNMKDNCNKPSKYRGIKYSKRMGKYVVRVFHKSSYEFVGEFDLASDAAWANDCKVKELKGDCWTLNFNTREEFECAKHLELQSLYGKGGGADRDGGNCGEESGGVDDDGGSLLNSQQVVSATGRKSDVGPFFQHTTFNRVSLCLEADHHDLLMKDHKRKVKLETYDAHHRARSLSPSLGQKRTIEHIHADSNEMHRQRESSTTTPPRSTSARRSLTDKIPRKRPNLGHAEALMQLATPIPSQQLSMDTRQWDREENVSDIEEGEIVEVDEEFAAPNRMDNESCGADYFHEAAEDQALMQCSAPGPDQRNCTDANKCSREENASDIEESGIIKVEEEFAATNLSKKTHESSLDDLGDDDYEVLPDDVKCRSEVDGIACNENEYLECSGEMGGGEANELLSTSFACDPQDKANKFEFDHVPDDCENQSAINKRTVLECEAEIEGSENADDLSTHSIRDTLSSPCQFRETHRQAFGNENDKDFHVDNISGNETHSLKGGEDKSFDYYQGLCKQLSEHLAREHRRKREYVQLRQKIAELKQENANLKKQVGMIEKVMSARDAVMDLFSD